MTDRVRIDGLAAGRDHLTAPGQAAGSVLVVPVDGRVPAWLSELVSAAEAAGASVVVEALPSTQRADAARHGWEIGVCTAALAAGAADVTGIDPRRVSRVREITTALATARPVGGEPS